MSPLLRPKNAELRGNSIASPQVKHLLVGLGNRLASLNIGLASSSCSAVYWSGDSGVNTAWTQTRHGHTEARDWVGSGVSAWRLGSGSSALCIKFQPIEFNAGSGPSSRAGRPRSNLCSKRLLRSEGDPPSDGAKRRESTRRIASGNALVPCTSAPPHGGAVGSYG